ncbi:Kelch repeat-containing protein, partial [Chloroflexus sp.]|uniref:Kelch repeat-containing protein n=1 Tax=Chloroflexus sp. TaxID=1904827 RepID=UPI002ACD622C
MPTARDGVAAAAGQNGRIYVFGGATAGFSRDTAEEYDPQTDTWRALRAMPTPREGAAAVTGADGRIYVFGGYNYASGWLATVEAYDPATDSWTTCASLTLDRGGLAGVRSAGSAFYALGGARSSGQEYVATVEVAQFPLPLKAYLPLIFRGG